ncbi:hypothetical protein BGZ52_010759 [Haplosporangium bisporale]|nr:hypothetical protein BGZ52_010759 [Haplosporangium bisporale]
MKAALYLRDHFQMLVTHGNNERLRKVNCSQYNPIFKDLARDISHVEPDLEGVSTYALMSLYLKIVNAKRYLDAHLAISATPSFTPTQLFKIAGDLVDLDDEIHRVKDAWRVARGLMVKRASVLDSTAMDLMIKQVKNGTIRASFNVVTATFSIYPTKYFSIDPTTDRSTGTTNGSSTDFTNYNSSDSTNTISTDSINTYNTNPRTGIFLGTIKVENNETEMAYLSNLKPDELWRLQMADLVNTMKLQQTTIAAMQERLNSMTSMHAKSEETLKGRIDELTNAVRHQAGVIDMLRGELDEQDQRTTTQAKKLRQLQATRPLGTKVTTDDG